MVLDVRVSVSTCTALCICCTLHLCVGAMDNFPFEDQQLIPCIFFLNMLMLVEFRMVAAEVRCNPTFFINH